MMGKFRPCRCLELRLKKIADMRKSMQRLYLGEIDPFKSCGTLRMQMINIIMWSNDYMHLCPFAPEYVGRWILWKLMIFYFHIFQDRYLMRSLYDCKCGKRPSKYWFENMEMPLRSRVTVISHGPRITKGDVEQRNYLPFLNEHVSSHLLISQYK